MENIAYNSLREKNMQNTALPLEQLENTKLNITEVEDIQRQFAQMSEKKVVRQKLLEWSENQSQSTSSKNKLKAALGFWLLGKFEESLTLLEKDQSELAYYLKGKIAAYQEDRKKEIVILEKGFQKYPHSLHLGKMLAKAYLEQRDIEKGTQLLETLKKLELSEEDILFLEGYLYEIQGDYEKGMEYYHQVLEKDPSHFDSHFRLAIQESLRGDEDKAIYHYKECTKKIPIYFTAWINLGLIYEDRGRYEEAIRCFEEVLRIYPQNLKARMYWEDCQFSLNMVYDEDRKKRTDRRKQILRIPIKEFELSVRARNCLNKMHIRTLGDLIEKTEEELLAYKNFGENSLQEIKDMLSKYNLSLGEGKRQAASPYPRPQSSVKTRNQVPEELLAKSIHELPFSKRAITGMEKLSIYTLGDLLSKSEADLMGVRNFGKVSLDNIKKTLMEMGLSLRKV
ncbi:MAG: tetratricopeptide repeat protein [Planctomycetota bacterium]|nr:MAG: tetratricopeptide repeat protein [Planctomycetota bacterium]